MIKMIGVVTRRPDVSREQLLDHWQNVHAPAVVETLKPKAYRLTFFEGQMGGGDAPYDGMAALWFDTLEACDSAMAAAADAPSDGFSELLIEDSTLMLFTSAEVALGGLPRM